MLESAPRLADRGSMLVSSPSHTAAAPHHATATSKSAQLPGRSRFRTYERVSWHAFHLPLCVLLYATAAIHVVAVHLR